MPDTQHRLVNRFERLAIFAGVGPHVFGVLTVAGYFITRWDPFLIIAMYGGFICLALVLIGLVAVSVIARLTRTITRRMLLILAMLFINFPASLVYAYGVLLVNGSVRVLVMNPTQDPLTDVTLEIGDETWHLPDIPPGAKDRKTLFYKQDSFNGVTLRARHKGEAFLRDIPEIPPHRRTVNLFRI
ncbi:MAG: hypothetical protein ACR2IE_07790 [Candidatus Sumerlaeaceae bacterium]